MARKYTGSLEEAENAALLIFLDIWKLAGRCDSTKFDEVTFIALIARRRLFLLFPPAELSDEFHLATDFFVSHLFIARKVKTHFEIN